jgi:hypothetical protein
MAAASVFLLALLVSSGKPGARGAGMRARAHAVAGPPACRGPRPGRSQPQAARQAAAPDTRSERARCGRAGGPAGGSPGAAAQRIFRRCAARRGVGGGRRRRPLPPPAPAAPRRRPCSPVAPATRARVVSSGGPAPRAPPPTPRARPPCPHPSRPPRPTPAPSPLAPPLPPCAPLAAANKIFITESNYNDIPLYEFSNDYTPVRVEVSSALRNPPKKPAQGAFGVEGEKVAVKATSKAVAIAPDGGNRVAVRSAANANTKWAPAKAYATAYGQNGGGNPVLVLAAARAVGKPAPQYGAVVSQTDAVGISGGGTPQDAGLVGILSTSRATGGQGQSIAGAFAYGESAAGTFQSVDARANAAKWYMAPGNAVAGAENIGRGGHIGLETDVRPRADLGTATGGVLNVAKSNGVQPLWFDALSPGTGQNFGGDGYPNIIYSITNNDPRSDAGAAIGGTVNIGMSARKLLEAVPEGAKAAEHKAAESEDAAAATGPGRKLLQKVVLLNDNMEASLGVGDAAAGVVNVGIANQGNVLIGDYDNSDATQNEVIARVRGRGYAQGGMVNVGECARGWGPGGSGVGGPGLGQALPADFPARPPGLGARPASVPAQAPPLPCLVATLPSRPPAAYSLHAPPCPAPHHPPPPGVAPNGDSEITGNVVVAADQGDAIAGALSESNAYGRASNDISVTSSTSEYTSVGGLIGVSQAQEQAQNTLASSARSNIGSALSYTIANSALGEIAVTTGSSSSTTVTGQAASMTHSQSIGGVTTESQAASTATTKDGHAASLGTAFSGSAFTAEAVSTSSATTTNGAALSGSLAGSFAADSEADSASSAATAVGNVGSASGAISLGVIQGKANSASSAASETGSVGSLSVAFSTGAIQAQAKVSSSAQTADGNAQSIAGAASISGINSVATTKSTAAAQTGDVDAEAEAYGVGGFHGEANADAAAATGCAECDSTGTAMAIATGAIADATARAKADSPKNPGQAIANAMALGAVSRTSNGGSARVAIGPAQALTGGFAVSAPRHVVNEVNKAAVSAMDPSKKSARNDAIKDALKKAAGTMLPKPVAKPTKA